MNRKQWWMAALMCAAFVVVVLIVGTIERGASAGLILLTVPALAVMAMSARAFEN